MRLKSSKVTSPKSQKKKSGSISQDEDMETDDETSGCYSQSPPSSGKVEKRASKFKTKQTHHVDNKLTMIIPNRRDNTDNGQTATKIGHFTMNTDVQININPRSPELSPNATRKGGPLTEKTMNRINQLELNQQTADYDAYKTNAKDDGNDSGVTSPQRLDSDDSDSGAHSSRKESLDSSGPSPRIQRRLPPSTLQRKISNSGSSNEERSPKLQKASTDMSSSSHNAHNDIDSDKRSTVVNRSIRRANKSKALYDKRNTDNPDGEGGQRTKVVKRSDSAVRRRNYPNSPRSGKRDLKSIIPGDGNDYEGQLRALLDGDMDELMCTKVESSIVAQKPNTLDLQDERTVVLSGAKTPDSGYNAEWWLSGNQNNYRRFLYAPKDKASALNIISNVIDSSRKTNSQECNELKDNENTSDLTARVNTHKQRNEEFEKKVTDILSTSPVSSYTDIKQFAREVVPTTTSNDLTSSSTGSLTESRDEKLDRYMMQVALLLGEMDDGSQEEKEQMVASLLKQFQVPSSTATNTPMNDNLLSKQRNHSDGSATNNNNNNNNNKISDNQHKPVIRSKSTSSKPRRKVERNSPLLDNTYSSLNYNKLYPR